jgi:hypothetical protein
MTARRLAWSTQWATTLLLVLAMLLGGATTSLAQATPAAAQSEIGVLESESTATLQFPTGIAIESTVKWDESAEDVRLELLYTAAGSRIETLAASPMKSVETPGEWSVEAVIELQRHYVPVGIELTWWWRLAGPTGVIAESVPETARWYDDRFDWESHRSEQVTLHEYSLDDTFSQEVLDSIQEAITGMEQRYGFQTSEPISVWIYATNDDFQVARPPNYRETIAAISYPGYRLIASILRNGDSAELLRVLPHEVSHHVLNQATSNPFSYVPLWFDEGLATHIQTGGTDGYMEMVTKAWRDGQLYNLNSLTAVFPYEPYKATLAYATSWSAITFLEETRGPEAVANLIAAFGTGLPYDEAISQALGIDSGQLNEEWTNWVASHAG